MASFSTVDGFGVKRLECTRCDCPQFMNSGDDSCAYCGHFGESHNGMPVVHHGPGVPHTTFVETSVLHDTSHPSLLRLYPNVEDTHARLPQTNDDHAFTTYSETKPVNWTHESAHAMHPINKITRICGLEGCDNPCYGEYDYCSKTHGREAKRLREERFKRTHAEKKRSTNVLSKMLTSAADMAVEFFTGPIASAPKNSLPPPDESPLSPPTNVPPNPTVVDAVSTLTAATNGMQPRPPHAPVGTQPLRADIVFSEAGPFRELTNGYNAAVRIDGVDWPTAEHYFHGMKFHHSFADVFVCHCADAAAVAAFSERFRTVMNTPALSPNDVGVAMRAQVAQNAAVRNVLLSTGRQPLLLDMSTGDIPMDASFWGSPQGDGSGFNVLATQWMKLRAELLAGQPEALSDNPVHQVAVIDNGELGPLMPGYGSAPFEVNGRQWRSVMHYVYSRRFQGVRGSELVRTISHAKDAAKFADEHAVLVHLEWQHFGRKEQIMRRVLAAKFTQHKALQEMLLSTGQSWLVYYSPEDAYWGDGGNRTGKNMLGRMLMDLREKLKKGGYISEEAGEYELAAFILSAIPAQDHEVQPIPQAVVAKEKPTEQAMTENPISTSRMNGYDAVVGEQPMPMSDT